MAHVSVTPYDILKSFMQFLPQRAQDEIHSLSLFFVELAFLKQRWGFAPSIVALSSFFLSCLHLGNEQHLWREELLDVIVHVSTSEEFAQCIKAMQTIYTEARQFGAIYSCSIPSCPLPAIPQKYPKDRRL
jgi:hypothetical protein